MSEPAPAGAHLLAGVDRSRVAIGNRRAVVLFSGGLDSTVALWWALLHYREVEAVTIDYGQRHRGEISAARAILRRTHLAEQFVTIQLPEARMPDGRLFVRGHTILMAGVAALGVSSSGADIVLGTLRTDPFIDVQPEYLAAIADGLVGPDDTGRTALVQPLHAVADKSGAAAVGFDLGAPVHLSWSCRSPQRAKPCRECPSCISRSRALADLNIRHADQLDWIRAWQVVLGSPQHPQFREVDPTVDRLAQEFVAAGGVRSGTPGWRYRAPDGSERFTPFIRPTRALRRRFAAPGASVHVRAHGLMPGTKEPWELVVCADGAVAASPRLPDVATIEEALLRTTAS